MRAGTSKVEDVVAIRCPGGQRLWVRFDDGVEGEVDLARFLHFRGMVSRLRDPKYFAKAYVHPEAGVVTWPNGVDIDTLLLYSWVTGRSIESLLNPKPWPKAATLATFRPKRRRTASAR